MSFAIGYEEGLPFTYSHQDGVETSGLAGPANVQRPEQVTSGSPVCLKG